MGIYTMVGGIMKINIIPPTKYENAFKIEFFDALIGSTIKITNKHSTRVMALHKVTRSNEFFWITGVNKEAILIATVQEE